MVLLSPPGSVLRARAQCFVPVLSIVCVYGRTQVDVCVRSFLCLLCAFSLLHELITPQWEDASASHQCSSCHQRVCPASHHNDWVAVTYVAIGLLVACTCTLVAMAAVLLGIRVVSRLRSGTSGYRSPQYSAVPLRATPAHIENVMRREAHRAAVRESHGVQKGSVSEVDGGGQQVQNGGDDEPRRDEGVEGGLAESESAASPEGVECGLMKEGEHAVPQYDPDAAPGNSDSE